MGGGGCGANGSATGGYVSCGVFLVVPGAQTLSAIGRGGGMGLTSGDNTTFGSLFVAAGCNACYYTS